MYSRFTRWCDSWGVVDRFNGSSVDENYRKLPRGRCIQRLMEGAGFAAPSPKNTTDTLSLWKYPAICQCRAYRQIVPAAYNAVGAQHSDGKITQCMEPPLPWQRPGRSP